MSRRWLSIALLLFASCYRNNPVNCVATPDSCSATQICDPASERCLDPTTIACSSVDCPSGTFCDQATMHCAFVRELNILSIDTPYLKNSGNEVVVIKGTGFMKNSIVLFNGTEGATTYVSSTELKVTTPPRPPRTPCGRLPLRVTNPDGNKKTVDALYSYYFEDRFYSPSTISTTLTQGAERLALTDLTLDGKNDLLVTMAGTKATVFAGSTTGFGSGFGVFFTANATFATADLRPERNFAFTADRNSPNLIVYKLKAGDMLDYSQVNNLASPSLESLALVDLNADNELDVIGLYTNGLIAYFIHEGAWTQIRPTSTYAPLNLPMTKAQSLVAGIYYGNKPLIASINRAAAEIDLAEFNSSVNSFTSIGTLKSSSNILEIFDGDFNGDGKKDLVVFNGGGSARIFYNDNGFDTGRIRDINLSLSITGATVGDLDCDGVPDLIGLNSSTGSPGVIFWTERSQSLAMFPLADRAVPRAVAIGDIDGDLVPDLVAYSAPTVPLTRIGVTPQM